MNLRDQRLLQYTEYKTGISIETEKQQKEIKKQRNECSTGGDEDSSESYVPPVFISGKSKMKSFIQSIFTFTKNLICFTGIWVWPILFYTGISFTEYRWLYLLLVAFILVGNISMYGAGKRRFGLEDAFNVLSLSDNIWRFQEQQQKNPPVRKELLLHTGGVYFGIKDKKHVGKNIETDGHVIVFGGSGSGKSSCIAIPTLNRYESGVFAIDIKDGGELRRKSTPPEGTRTYIFQPGDTESLGYDPFWFLDKKNPEAGIKEIVYALIPVNAKNPSDYWTMNEQRYLLSALYYCYAQGQSFAESCRTIYALSEKELLERIKNSDCRFAREGMSDYYNMSEETLGGIVGGVGNAITTFVTDKDILDVLTKKHCITPNMLLQGNRIFVCIPEHKLDVYKELLQLIISQFLRWFEQLKDEETRPVLFVLDEFARLGRYDRLINGLATLRSKKVTIMILTQSISQLDALYGADNRKVMVDNCAYKVILNASDADSQEYFSRIVGKYTSHKRSFTRGKQSSYSISEQELPIIKPEAFTTLDEVILLSPFGLQRIKKNPYYKTPKIFEKI